MPKRRRAFIVTGEQSYWPKGFNAEVNYDEETITLRAEKDVMVPAGAYMIWKPRINYEGNYRSHYDAHGEVIKKRRSAHTCVLCQEMETHEWDHICFDCQKHWAAGREMSEQLEEQEDLVTLSIRGNSPSLTLGEPESNALTSFNVPPSAQMSRFDREKKAPGYSTLFRELIPRLTGKTYRKVLPIGSPERFLIGEGYYRYGDGGIFVTIQQAEAVRDLVFLFQRVYLTGYENGYDFGSNILARIARDDLSIEKINEAEEKRQRHS